MSNTTVIRNDLQRMSDSIKLTSFSDWQEAIQKQHRCLGWTTINVINDRLHLLGMGTPLTIKTSPSHISKIIDRALLEGYNA
jgi:hypothetical protein